MFVKVFVAVIVAAAIFHPAITANVPDPAEASNSLDASVESEATEIEGRAGHYQNVNNWNEKKINDKYSVEDLPALAYALNKIYNGNAASFNQMVNLQLYLFNKYDNNGDVNFEYTFNVAYYFSQIKNNRFYANLSYSLRNSLNKYISYLPPSLDYLFFQSSFCLLNRKHEKYIYATDMHIDSKRDYVFVWNKDANNNPNKVAWTAQLNDVSNNRQTKLKFTLKNVISNQFAYMERNSYNGKRNLLASWRTSNQQPANAEWTVSLYQYQLIFKQNGRVICASDSLYDRSRRYVYGMNGNGEDAAECQWYAKDCP